MLNLSLPRCPWGHQTFVPPYAEATPQMMAARTEPIDQSEAAEGNVLSHLLVGDFDQYAWKKKTDESFHEWTGDGGMWELSDPTAPTHKKGPKWEKKNPVPTNSCAPVRTNRRNGCLLGPANGWGRRMLILTFGNMEWVRLFATRPTPSISRLLQGAIRSGYVFEGEEWIPGFLLRRFGRVK